RFPRRARAARRPLRGRRGSLGCPGGLGAALDPGPPGAAALIDRERQLRNLDRQAFLLGAVGRAAEAARYEMRTGFLRQSVEIQPHAGDGASLEPSGPVFEGEPLLDW